MDWTGSGSCAVTEFGIIGSGTSGSDARELFIYLLSDVILEEIGCEDGRWLERAQVRVQGWSSTWELVS